MSRSPSLALFDLDNTLIAGDSDYLWGQFLVDQGVVDAEAYEQANRRFYDDYKAGRLDIQAFLDFSLRPLADNPRDHLLAWREQFIETCIRPVLLPAAEALIERHREAGDTLVVITATNRFVTQPIVELYGIENLIATDVEEIDGRFTGRGEGEPCFQQGKIHKLQVWLDGREGFASRLEGELGDWFYSDSHNDLPLLERVANPVAVDADERLLAEAKQRGWVSISLRG